MSQSSENNAEMLYYYNEKGDVLGSAPRKEIHDRGLINKHVAYLITNCRNQLLLQLRSQNKKDNPGVWDKPGGHVLIGEQDLAREFLEEMCHELPDISAEIVPIEKFKHAIRQTDLGGKAILTKVKTILNFESIRRRSDGTHVKEIVHVDLFVGKYDGPLSAQPNEVEKISPFSRQDLITLIEKNPEQVGPDTVKYFKQFASKIFE